MSESDTRTQLLEVAQELVQKRGYSGFSFHDLAERVGIKTASIHYHFPTKKDLGQALVKQHRQLLGEEFARIDAEEPDAWERLRLYTRVFRSTLADGFRMCLGGILAIEYQNLPPALVVEVRGCFEDNERWLANTLKAGKKDAVIVFDRSAEEVARALFASLEGALLSARAFGDLDRFDMASNWLLAQFKP